MLDAEDGCFIVQRDVTVSPDWEVRDSLPDFRGVHKLADEPVPRQQIAFGGCVNTVPAF